MTKKNYEKAAKLVRQKRKLHNRSHQHLADRIEDAYVELFKNDNPRFDEERFRFACNREVK